MCGWVGGWVTENALRAMPLLTLLRGEVRRGEDNPPGRFKYWKRSEKVGKDRRSFVCLAKAAYLTTVPHFQCFSIDPKSIQLACLWLVFAHAGRIIDDSSTLSGFLTELIVACVITLFAHCLLCFCFFSKKPETLILEYLTLLFEGCGVSKMTQN